MREGMYRKKWERPICYWQKFDCFAYESGVCDAMTSTNFSRGRCPFYKTVAQVREERKRTEKRLREKGLDWKGRKLDEEE